MIEQIKHFESIYELTPSMKAKVSLSSVKRAIKSMQEAGILTVKPFTHTKRGGKTHNTDIALVEI